MKRIIHNQQHMLKCLVATSFLMFISLFISPKIAALGMTIWIIIIGWIMYLLTVGRIGEMKSYHDKTTDEALKNKKYFEYGIRSIAFPLCVVGLVVIIVNLVVMFNL